MSIATLKQQEARRHNWVMYQLKGTHANITHIMPATESIALKINNFFSELRQIEFARYKRNKEKLNISEKDSGEEKKCQV